MVKDFSSSLPIHSNTNLTVVTKSQEIIHNTTDFVFFGGNFKTISIRPSSCWISISSRWKGEGGAHRLRRQMKRPADVYREGGGGGEASLIAVFLSDPSRRSLIGHSEVTPVFFYIFISIMSKSMDPLDNQKNCTLTHWYIHSVISTQVTHLSLSFWPRYCFWDTCDFLCRPSNFLGILSSTRALWYYELLSMKWRAPLCTFYWSALRSLGNLRLGMSHYKFTTLEVFMQQFLLHGQAGRLSAGIQAANELLRVTEGYWILITFTARRCVIDYLQQSRALVSPVAEVFRSLTN